MANPILAPSSTARLPLAHPWCLDIGRRFGLLELRTASARRRAGECNDTGNTTSGAGGSDSNTTTTTGGTAGTGNMGNGGSGGTASGTAGTSSMGGTTMMGGTGGSTGAGGGVGPIGGPTIMYTVDGYNNATWAGADTAGAIKVNPSGYLPLTASDCPKDS